MNSEPAEEPRPPLAWTTGPVPFVVTLAVYIVLGLYLKSGVLNWIVGPLFPLLALYLLPAALRRLAGRGR